MGEVCAEWMTTLQEYELEIKLVKIVRGKGLCQMGARTIGNDDSKEGRWESRAIMYEVELVKVADTPESWYSNLKYYLSIGNVPIGLDA